MQSLGIYLHIPFCESKCRYCDFYSMPHRPADLKIAYVEAICRDLSRRAADCADYEIDTIYFGGGTPTSLAPADLARILQTVVKYYRVTRDAEITAECNPGTVDANDLRTLRAAGFNRLSIGLQSAHANELKELGRLHDFRIFESVWNDARRVGFSNLSADVMFGIPHQTLESFLQTLETVCQLSPEHLSAYALTIEEGTPFARRAATMPLPDEDQTREMYLSMIDFLRAHGLEQYEISNFARPGLESRHNLKYWMQMPYLGFGPAAHSDFSGKRIANSRDLDGYLAGKDISASEQPTKAEREDECVMLSMRLCEGLSKRVFANRFGREPTEYLDRLRAYLSDGFIRETADGFAFTPEGFLVSNTILSSVLTFGKD